MSIYHVMPMLASSWLVYSVVVAFIYRRVLTFQRESIRAENESAGMVQQIFAGLSKFRVQGAEEQAFLLWSRVFGGQYIMFDSGRDCYLALGKLQI